MNEVHLPRSTVGPSQMEWGNCRVSILAALDCPAKYSGVAVCFLTLPGCGES